MLEPFVRRAHHRSLSRHVVSPFHNCCQTDYNGLRLEIFPVVRLVVAVVPLIVRSRCDKMVASRSGKKTVLLRYFERLTRWKIIARQAVRVLCDFARTRKTPNECCTSIFMSYDDASCRTSPLYHPKTIGRPVLPPLQRCTIFFHPQYKLENSWAFIPNVWTIHFYILLATQRQHFYNRTEKIFSKKKIIARVRRQLWKGL